MKQGSRLEDWFFTKSIYDSNLVKPAEGAMLHGKIYGDLRFADGTAIHTSTVVEVNEEGGYVVTKSGTKYILGNISPEYAQWVKDKGGKQE